jgi:hypothetical protein
MERYWRFFPVDDIMFTIPKDCAPKSTPSPFYHFIEGAQVFVMDWQVSHPNHHLHCPTCNDERLEDDQFNFMKNWTLFPIFTKSSTAMWGAVMHYKCKNCEMRVAGNDRYLLNTLSAHIRQAYPVEPGKAGPTLASEKTPQK